jgi:hypothetical protein
MGFLNIAIILRILLGFFKYFMHFLEISWDFGIPGFSKILGFFQRFFGIFDEVYEDFQSNLPLVFIPLPINTNGMFLPSRPSNMCPLIPAHCPLIYYVNYISITVNHHIYVVFV